MWGAGLGAGGLKRWAFLGWRATSALVPLPIGQLDRLPVDVFARSQFVQATRARLMAQGLDLGLELACRKLRDDAQTRI